MLASKPYQAPLGGPSSHPSSSYHSASSHKTTTVPSSNNSSRLTSPTGSVFSDSLDELDSVRCAWHLRVLGCAWTDDGGCRSWDETKVVEWLRSVKCGQYEGLFRGTVVSVRILTARKWCLTRTQQTMSTATTFWSSTKRSSRRWGSKRSATECGCLSPSSSLGIRRCSNAKSATWFVLYTHVFF